MRFKNFLRVASLFVFLVSFMPVNQVVLAATTPPPTDLFQLPWDQGLAWVAIDGIDNTSERPASSSHNYLLGGAIDFAPHNNMITGENTSDFWVTAVAAGTVISLSSCHIILDHGNGWLSQYQSLGNIQVKLGDTVTQNQRLGIIADGIRIKYCLGSIDPNVPHLHFMLRPTLIGATFAGWLVKYNWFFNHTSFTRNGVTVGLYKPLLNAPVVPTPTLTPTLVPTVTPRPGTASLTPSTTPLGFPFTPTPTLVGPYVSTTVNPQSINNGETAIVTVSLNNVPADGYTSAEFTCHYAVNGFEVSNISITNLFGIDPATVINDPRNGSFIVAIAGSQGNKATTSGTVITFSAKALLVGQAGFGCEARVSKGDNVLTTIGSTFADLIVFGDTTSTPTPDFRPSATPTLFGPYVSTTVNPASINAGETAVVTVSLNNVPSDGYTNAEFTCFEQNDLFEVSNITATSLFGFNPVVSINNPQNRGFTFTISGSNGSKAATSGAVFTFTIKGLRVDQGYFGCEARVSKGDNVFTNISSALVYLTIAGGTPATLTFTPTIPPLTCDKAEFIADVTVPAGTVMLPGQTFLKTWRLKNVGSCAWSTSYQLVLLSGDLIDAPTPTNFTQNVDVGQTVDITIPMAAPYTAGSYTGHWILRNASGAFFGVGALGNETFSVNILVSGPTVTRSAPTNSPTPGSSPASTSTPSSSNWLTFTDLKYGFEFKYPPGGQIVGGQTNNSTRIDLPFVAGTNLQEKYVHVDVVEGANPCVSPVVGGTNNAPENVTINNIPFVWLAASEGAAGHLYDWITYSTVHDNACISLAFILHSYNPAIFATPPAVFDKSTESIVFTQIMTGFAWLTTSPILTATRVGFPTPAQTPSPSTTTSPVPDDQGIVNGTLLVPKSARITLSDINNTSIRFIDVNPDGTFGFSALAGTYRLTTLVDGFLSAERTVTITAGNTSVMPSITLLAGDIDGNNVIDQFDALTIGMNYNGTSPSAADLNNDGIINVLDLELIAENYRDTGPTVWQ